MHSNRYLNKNEVNNNNKFEDVRTKHMRMARKVRTILTLFSYAIKGRKCLKLIDR